MADRRSINGYLRLSLYVFLALSVAATNVDIQQELLARMKTLEEKGRQQEMMITDYKERVEFLEKTVAELQQAASGDSQPIRNGATAESGGVTKPRTPPADGMTGLMHNRRALMQGVEAPVAFHAVIKAAGEVAHLGAEQKIVFPDIMLNLAGGYHNLSGVFIAPQHGLYMFSATITSAASDHVEILTDIVVNGIDLVGIYAHGIAGKQATQSSTTAMTLLDAGDEVWIKMIQPPDTKLWGGRLTSFTGCLLVAM